jgi:hypothetical protein
MQRNRCIFNGIDGTTGGYLLPPLAIEQLSAIAQGEEIDEEQIRDLRWWHRRFTQAHLGPLEGVDANSLAESGWGIIFAHDSDPAVREALNPLLTHRREQATRINPRFYQEFSSGRGYRPGETKQAFLTRHGTGPGPTDPEQIPYYLLIVGSPESIPFAFQYQLDIQYAVGRIHFETLDEYANYAGSIVASETSMAQASHRVAFFATENSDDYATSLSANDLVRPLIERLRKQSHSWEFTQHLGDNATKAQLARLLGGSETPSLLFTASHGMGFPNGDSRQLPHQGALLCQDWPGPSWNKSIPQDFYFAGDDLASDARLAGLVSFHFACYGAGTPHIDDFSRQVFRERQVVAPHAFLANLPRRLLSHSKGGALAVIGHVERAWSYSFEWEQAGRQVQTFESALRRIMNGQTVGSAIEYFNLRYAELASDLSSELEAISYGKVPDDLALVDMWTASNDARNFVIIGDPAVRI